MNIEYKLLDELSEEFGDGFYLLDSKQFDNNYQNLAKAFGSIYPNFNIAYSYKTNYTPKLCEIVNRHGGYAEIVSEMEMKIAIKSGVAPERIIWNGPVKDKKKVEELLINNGTVNVDSLSELHDILELSKKYRKMAFNVGIRCNYDVGDGVVSRFGIDVNSEDFKEAISIFKYNGNLHLINVQCHFAKRNVEYWKARTEIMIDNVRYIEKELGYLPDRIDLGGGIYGNMEECLKEQFESNIPSYEDYANIAGKLMKEAFPDCKPELIIEPGTALAGDCMKFVCKVKAIKAVGDKYFATVMGSQKNISMTGVNPPIHIFSNKNKRRKYKNLDIVGYTCIESDILYKNYEGEISEGDYVVISNCGSYSLVMKPPFILPNFSVLDISGESIRLIKKRESFDDLFRTFIF